MNDPSTPLETSSGASSDASSGPSPGTRRASASDVVILLDVDNTLLDNDQFAADLDAHLKRKFSVAAAEHYWTLYNRRREELGVADYLGTLQEFRTDFEDHPSLLTMSQFLLDYPFAGILYPQALETIAALQRSALPVVLSDGDVVFQPRKIQRSGIWNAVDNRVLIHLHKERVMESVVRAYPAAHYIAIDDKPHLLSAMKRALGSRISTIFVRQGHYALEAQGEHLDPPPDVTIERIAEMIDFDLSPLAAVAAQRRRDSAQVTPQVTAHLPPQAPAALNPAPVPAPIPVSVPPSASPPNTIA